LGAGESPSTTNGIQWALRKGLKEFMECRHMATWRSGYAAVCKTVYPGSIPGVASTKSMG
jgi:hypothetical protein